MSRYLRERLNSVLPTDSDLDAFLQSECSDVYRRLSVGMDRVQKFNLLFNLRSETDVSACLDEWCTSLSHQNQHAVKRFPPFKLTVTGFFGNISGALFLLLAVMSGSVIGGLLANRDSIFAMATARPEFRAKTSMPDTFAGSIYDGNGKPVQDARLILVGTNCSATSDKTGAFSFENCGKALMASLSRPRVNIYRTALMTIQNVELYAPPTRTVINIINNIAMRTEASHLCDERVETCSNSCERGICDPF